MEKTEQPTAKKLREARARGEVPRSSELSAAAVLLAAWALLVVSGGAILTAIVGSWELALAAVSGDLAARPSEALVASAALALEAIAPLLLATVIAAALAGLVQTGPLFTVTPVTPSLARLDPVRGLRALFSQRRAIELGKAAATLAVIGFVCFVTLRGSLRGVLGLVERDASDAIFGTGAVAARLLLRVGLVLAAIAAADVVYQRWRHRQDLKMTREELARERRAAEGDPQTRAKRARAHREILSQMRADLVVAWGAELAVSLRYDARAAAAPEVARIDRGPLAQRTLEAASRAAVHVADDPSLARALAELEVGAAIPPSLYEPVARHLHAGSVRA